MSTGFNTDFDRQAVKKLLHNGKRHDGELKTLECNMLIKVKFYYSH